MNRLASPAQLRASFVRWALFLVPAVLLLGFVSRQLAGSIEDPWFLALDKPAIFLPPAVFEVVWLVLDTLTGFAAAMVCAAWGSRYRLPAILAFVLQLLVKLAWPPVFFGEHEMSFAVYLIVVLDLAIVVTVALFWQVRRAAAWLLLPYLAWAVYASILNYEFLRLNPEADGIEGSYPVQRIEL
jgi:tryptophan-rich sensory protein